MDANMIYSSALEQLNLAMLAMLSEEWDTSMHTASFEDRQKAMVQLLKLQQARLAMGNAVLQEIAGKLRENEAALFEGKLELRKALDRIDDVANVLNGIAAFVGVVARIVPVP